MLRDAQMAGNSLFLCVSMRVLLEKISIWISKLNKEGCSHQCGQASSNLLRIQIEQTSWREGKFSLLEWDIHLLLLPWNIRAPGTWAFRLQNWNQHPLRFSDLWPSGWDLYLHTGSFRDFRLRLNYTINFPGSPTYRWHPVRLLTLHNHINQLP